AAYKAAVEGMRDASPEAKAQALRQWPQVQRQWAAQMAPILWAERDIPGLPSFMKWREEQIGQDQASRGRTGFTKLPMEDQVLKYVGEMKNRPGWAKHADTFTRSLVSAAGSVGSSLLGVAGMMQKVMPFSGLAGKALGVDPGEVLSGLAADWSRSNQEISAGLEVKGGLDTTGLKATALLGNIIPQVGLGGIAKGGMLLNTALAAAQSTGQVYADAYGKLRAEGKGHEEAWRATAPYAVGSGIATAVLTAAGARLGGGAGMKKGLDLAVKDPAVKAAARAAWSQQFPRLAGAGNAVRDMAVDGVMEMPDEYFNQLASALAANPQANVAEVTADFIRSSPEIMKTVAAMGALGKVAGPGPGMGKGGAASPGLAAADTGVNALREAQGAVLPVDGKSLAGAEAKLPGPVNAMPVNDVKHPLVTAQALPGGGNPGAGTVTEALPLNGAVEGASPAGQVSGVDENSVKHHYAEPGVAPPGVGSAAAQAVASVPLWEGKAPRGEAVQVLDRNPDGTWQVMLGGREMTAKESQMAVMTGMRKPDVDAFVQQHGLRQDDAAVQAPGVPLGQASHAEPGRLQKLVQRASRTLQQAMPGVTGRHGRVLEGGRQLLADAAYLQERGREFSPEEQEAILSGEGFYDPLTNRSFVFAGQVQPKAGESARAAVHRVFLHETVGHDGLAQVLAAGGRALRNFKHLVEKIRLNQPEVYAAVAQDPAYAHLEGDPVRIGLEIMGRETERRPELLKRPSVFRDMKLLLGHALAQLQIRLGLRPESAADLDRQVDLLLGRARRAAERDGRVDATHVTGEGLLFKKGTISPEAARFQEKQLLAKMSEQFIGFAEADAVARDAARSPEERFQILLAKYPWANAEQQRDLRTWAEGFDPASEFSVDVQATRRMGMAPRRQSMAEVQAKLSGLSSLTLGPAYSATPPGMSNLREVVSPLLGRLTLQENWWKGQKGKHTELDSTGQTYTPFRSPLDAVRPHIDQIVREGHVALTRNGLEGEREHFITHPVQVGGQSQIAVVVARARANGEMEVETGPVRLYSPADFQKVLENEQMCDNLFELPGTVEDYGGEEQRNALKNLVNRAQTHEEAQGLVHAFEKMRGINYELVNVSLHYRGNQGLDMIFRTREGELALVAVGSGEGAGAGSGTETAATREPGYAVVEAKHGRGPEALSKDVAGRIQASPEYNLHRLEAYIDQGDNSHIQFADHLYDLAQKGVLKSFATFYIGKSICEVKVINGKLKFLF
ncbi:MAG TPA: hypothetical protein VGE29_02975, partial [Prosthecobacter sp.]